MNQKWMAESIRLAFKRRGEMMLKLWPPPENKALLRDSGVQTHDCNSPDSKK